MSDAIESCGCESEPHQCVEADPAITMLQADLAARDAEIARLTAELAAARAVPPDVAAAIGDLEHSAFESGHGYGVADMAKMRRHADLRVTSRNKLYAAISAATASQPATVGGLLATGIADDVRAWCVECDVDILTDGESGDRCDWLTFVRGEQDANDERDRAIERLVEEGHAADVDAAEKMVRVVPLVPVRGPIVEVPNAR